jgi:hypothetical protein
LRLKTVVGLITQVTPPAPSRRLLGFDDPGPPGSLAVIIRLFHLGLVLFDQRAKIRTLSVTLWSSRMPYSSEVAAALAEAEKLLVSALFVGLG